MSLKIAVVGCGVIAPLHIRGILAAGGEIAALCDEIADKAKALADQYALNAKIYQSYEEMLANERLDAVHVCTPHYLHAPMCVSALKRNINVLCEKPLFITMEQLADLRKAQSESTAQLGVCHQNRYEPNMIKLKQLCEQGVTGGMGEVVWARDESYYTSAQWRGTMNMEGGGALINQALHTLDIMQWVCGFPESVTAHVSTDALASVMETEDTAMARYTLPDGRVFNFYATVGAKINLPVLMRVQLSGGTVVEAENEVLLINGDVDSTPERKGFVGKREWGTGHASLIADYYRHVTQGTHFPIDLEEGARVVRMILAAYRSNGRKVNIE